MQEIYKGMPNAAEVINDNFKEVQNIEVPEVKPQFEKGSDSRGTWVKRADGTMDYYFKFTIKGTGKEYGAMFYWDGTPSSITFPQAFKEPPVLSFSASSSNFFLATSSVKTTGISGLVAYRLNNSDLSSGTIYVKASGYWATAPNFS